MSLSSGLVAAYNKQTSGAFWVDLTGKGNNIALTNTSWEGDGLRADSNGEIGRIDNTGASVVNSENGTVIMSFKSIPVFDNETGTCLFGHRGASPSPEGSFALTKLADNNIYFILRDDVREHYIALNNSNFPSWQAGTQITLSWSRTTNVYDEKKIAVAVDGVYQTPGFSSYADAYNSFTVNDTLGILNDNRLTTSFANGDCEHVYLFSTVKTAAELVVINANHNLILADYFYTQGTNTIGINVSVGL